MNDDLISRQAAMYIADDIRACISVYGYWALVERLKALSTAEPGVIYCKECVYYEYKNEYSGLCNMGGEWAPDDYCSYGRRPKHG